MPIGKRLGEKVFADSALKLKPYLTQAVKSLDLSLHGYSKVVTSILEGTTIVVEHSSDHTLKNQLVRLLGVKQLLHLHMNQARGPRTPKKCMF
nr:neurofilament heavy polypeptide-like isoform X1 [Ipomoea batatas]